MTAKKWSIAALGALLLVAYNGAQPSIEMMRTMDVPNRDKLSEEQLRLLHKERYGPSLEWLDRLSNSETDKKTHRVPLNFQVLSSVMIAGLASGFKSQVANLLWMKSDEYWHKGLTSRQVPLMEAVVTLDPQFIDAWSTAGWHWAYNIYADVELDPKLKGKTKQIRELQDNAIETGLDYLKRGSAMNPDTYRLWFEYGWTRAEKAGYNDEETVDLFRTARSKKDAREIEQTQKDGSTKKVNGLDIVGRKIGHMYEERPAIDKALDQYGNDLLKATPTELALLRENGKYWRRYGQDYTVIANLYDDPATRAAVVNLVPDAAEVSKAQAMRQQLAGKKGGDQPTGAYISIVARYVPTWDMMKEADALDKAGQEAAAQAKYGQAENMIIGVMNADPRYHLQGLPILGKVMELRGDSQQAIQASFKASRDFEKSSAQSIGLQLLATIYEHQAAAENDATKKKALYEKAYETWYRSRVRTSLNFYAKRKTQEYEDNPRFAFKTPQKIVDQVKESRKSGDVNAAPPPPPNVPQYQSHSA